MRHLLPLGFAAALALALLPGSVRAQDKMRIGTTPESYPPFTTVDASGQVSGFEYELGNAICAAAKLSCTWVLQAWDGIIPALQESKFDAIIASMSITDERRQVVSFTNKYYDTPAMFIGRKADKIEISETGLKGKTIGVQVSTTHSNYATAKYGKVATIKTYDTQENATLDLIAERLDLVLADSVALSEGLLKTPDGADIEQKGPPVIDPLFGDGVGIALRKSDAALLAKLNAAIAQVRADGTYKTLNDKYFTFDVYGG